MENKNYSNVFLRDCIVGACSFLYDLLEITQVNGEGQEEKKKVPIFYSMTGEEQFLTDYFLNTDKYCNDLSCKIEGNVKKIPSGILTFTSPNVKATNRTSPYNRIVYARDVDTEVTKERRQFSARGEFLPISALLTIKIKCGSDLERFKIWEEMVLKLDKVRKFYISNKYLARIPCLIALSDTINLEKNFVFKYNENQKRPELATTLEFVSYLPKIDFSTERPRGEVIQNIDMNID